MVIKIIIGTIQIWLQVQIFLVYRFKKINNDNIKKKSNKTSLFFEENKQRLSNAKQRLWNFEEWATSPSFTVLLIKHNECIGQNKYSEKLKFVEEIHGKIHQKIRRLPKNHRKK